MSWSYDPESPNEPLNRVRLRIGDTVSTDPQISDEEIEYFLDTESSEDVVVVRCLRILAAKYARYADKWVGDLKILASQKHAHYLKQIELIEGSSFSFTGAPSAGGISYAQKEAYEQDTDRIGTAIRIGVHDNPDSPVR